MRAAAGVARGHQRSALGRKRDIGDPAFLDHLGALGGGVPPEHMVELRAPYLVGIGETLVPGIGKVDPRRPAVLRRDELGAVFRHADAFNLVGDAELLEEREVEGQQGLADMEARMLFLFDEHDALAALGEQRRDGRAARSAAHDEHVASGFARRESRIGHAVTSMTRSRVQEYQQA